MGLSDEEVATVRAAATVHDIGKLDVPREILNKPGKLTPEEFDVVKHHARTAPRWSPAWVTPS